jgi:hypothetical protein
VVVWLKKIQETVIFAWPWHYLCSSHISNTGSAADIGRGISQKNIVAQVSSRIISRSLEQELVEEVSSS